MIALENHLILFDAECPVCDYFSKAIEKKGLLKSGSRVAYQEFPTEACPFLDRKRALEEIALINLASGEVKYGIQSLIQLVGSAYPATKPLLSFPPFLWLMGKLYAFISFNRRIILPVAQAKQPEEFKPALRLRYRVAYLIVAWAITVLILAEYTNLMQGILPDGGICREAIVCGGQLLFQGVLITLVAKQKRWDYLGNMMTISLAGALLLLPLVVVAQFWVMPAHFYAAYFLCVAGLMLLEHIRRSRLMQIGWALTLSWVLYRIIVLVFIILSHNYGL